MISLIICDLDGTLIDSREDLASAVNFMRRFYGLDELPLDIVTDYIGDGARKLVERSIADHDIDLDQALKIMKERYHDHLFDRTVLYPGIEKGLMQIRKSGLKTAIVSNKPIRFTEKIVTYFKLCDHFDLVVGGDMDMPLKPHPALIEYSLNVTNASNFSSWIIGDHYTDLEAGRRSGIKRCFAAYGFGNDQGEAYDLKVDSFSEFVEFLRSSQFIHRRSQ